MTPELPALDEKLLPCPFCGADVARHYEGSGDWVFECGGCTMTFTIWIRGGDEPVCAREAWNRRSSIPPSPSAVSVEAMTWLEVMRDNYARAGASPLGYVDEILSALRTPPTPPAVVPEVTEEKNICLKCGKRTDDIDYDWLTDPEQLTLDDMCCCRTAQGGAK